MYKLHILKVNTASRSTFFEESLLPSPHSTLSYFTFPIEKATQRFYPFTTLLVPNSEGKQERKFFIFIHIGLLRKLISIWEGFCSSELSLRNTNLKKKTNQHISPTLPAASSQFVKLFFPHYNQDSGMTRNEKWLKFLQTDMQQHS